jgi:predicted GNAT family acetyltransferase
MSIEVRRNADRSRYELVVDGRVTGRADYREADGSVVFFHTAVDRPQRGRGLGARLVRDALDDVRASGGTVVAQCSFVARFIKRHPEYGDLVAGQP